MIEIDRIITAFDRGLRTLFAPASSLRPQPGEEMGENQMSSDEKRVSASLMRINHSGEICAQALYQGQAMTAKNREIARSLEQASWEETEHLSWTENRIAELGGRKSFLNPLWYTGSLAIGVGVGLIGDKWNLGFLAETERQVERHLAGHFERLPRNDQKSRAVVEQMKLDEARHAAMAVSLGAAELPVPARMLMKLSSKVMTGLTYWV
ncbi:MAG: 2-polyprenyl-3-methyl-6-methoxy-1,4-benzoquinone monooxygenase [Burkholderiales bacterium]|nr:2-polyprenyl-3-methyl-6-methoxy-1,4-benzoquinone monooxygenase [Burkholderiales bacterium]